MMLGETEVAETGEALSGVKGSENERNFETEKGTSGGDGITSESG